MVNNGVPVALCSDDPAIFGNMGLTYDFFQVSQSWQYFYQPSPKAISKVLVGSEINGLMTMKALARQGLEVRRNSPF